MKRNSIDCRFEKDFPMNITSRTWMRVTSRMTYIMMR